MTKIAIFVSGSGTNCENIIRYFSNNAEVSIGLVVSNRSDAYALVRADRLGVPSVVLPKADFAQPEKTLSLLRNHGIDFIVLAGFLLLVPPYLIEAYPRRIINLHPALLPKYGGKGMYGHHVHEAVKAAGEAETGITIHYVNAEFDRGEIIAQFRTPLVATDTVADIEKKVHELEQAHFPKVIESTVRTK
ncbi:MAG: phosphoribosylglycinamide formyltransferase [Alloprevotella sp.]|nr:phosphoribosylglycinamide formyltransferase [Alloprevotella sp.]